MRQSEKMAAVGQLAGGIAHDLNNGLTPVMGYLDMLLLDSSGQTSVLLNEAKLATQRCVDVVRQLLSFGRPTTQAKSSLSVARLCEEFRRLAHTILPPTISVKIECTPDAGVIEGNETDIMNVLTNLAINAKDAMQSNGSLTVTASRVKAGNEKRSFKDQGTGEQGDYALIAVTDSGEGMPREVVTRIFEPFFTTKVKGKGTGLGLSMVYNTLKDHNGWIEVSSIEGEGTTFQIFLPLSASQTMTDSSHVLNDKEDVPHGVGLILLVDDEDSCALWASGFLKS